MGERNSNSALVFDEGKAGGMIDPALAKRLPRVAFLPTAETRRFHPCPTWERFVTGADELGAPAFNPVIALGALEALVREHGSDYGLVWVKPGDQAVLDDLGEEVVFLLPEFSEEPIGEAVRQRGVGVSHPLCGDKSITEQSDLVEGLVEDLGE